MGKYLTQINSPMDLKALTTAQLELLAEELREEIIATVAQNGGHLAPNLGVVELTLALHRVFSTPRDKIVWDVGHQCYVHKLITGRRKQFGTLRRHGGLSGFPKPEESKHDAFGTGHSSTSISAAVGMAVARDCLGKNNSVVAVIGDGAMTGGMAFEALNHAGSLKTDLIVLLNDNEMSISHNVGAMSGYLTRIRTDPKYARSKKGFEQLLRRIPSVGTTLLKLSERFRDSLKTFVLPGMLFEELGFTYLGPVDGHSLPALHQILDQAKKMSGPVLVHVITQKGRGYEPAFKKADKFHGIGPFDIDSGDCLKKSDVSTYTSVFGKTLVQLAQQNPKVVAITAAMCSGTGLDGFAEKFPQRFYDVAIAEQHAVTMAAGLAISGLQPVVAVYSTFLQRAYDQVLHDVCLQELPVVLAIDRGGIVGDDGPTHHGLLDFSFLRSVPNLVVMAPADENELRQMLYTALRLKCPCALRYPRGAGLGAPLAEAFEELPLGKSQVITTGRDVTLLAVGNMVDVAQGAAEILQELGIMATVINARFVKPLDEGCILEHAAATGHLVTIEENMLAGGFGSAVLELLQQKGLTGIAVTRLGIPDVFVEHGSQSLLREKYGLVPQKVAAQVQALLGRKSALHVIKKPAMEDLRSCRGK